MIAATALEHGLTVLTRNVSKFEPPALLSSPCVKQISDWRPMTRKAA
ncbi:hypothetical protein [Rhodoplanes elegans]